MTVKKTIDGIGCGASRVASLDQYARRPAIAECDCSVQQFAQKPSSREAGKRFRKADAVRIVVSTATRRQQYAAKWACTGVEIRRPKYLHEHHHCIYHCQRMNRDAA